MTERAIASLIYDFDKTLSPRDMQEYSFLPDLRIPPDAFWAECREVAVARRMDGVLAYMYKMREKALAAGRPLTRAALNALGANVEFFPGVEDWFSRINAIGDALGLTVEHYIISSGLKEIIDGSRIAGHFQAVFAAEFCYDECGRAVWPATAVNYTSKTQYLFRVNKGILDVTNDVDLNRFTPEDRRRIPFRNMIYVGDGLTDVPCMKMTRSKGGFAVAVYPDENGASIADDLLIQNRADFAQPADYRAGGGLETVVRALLARIKAADDCVRLHNAQLDAARLRIRARSDVPSRE